MEPLGKTSNPEQKPEKVPDKPTVSKSDSKVDKVAGGYIIPEAPGPVPVSRTVEKVRADIAKTRAFIASGGKVETFSEQIAAKAVEITTKSRTQIVEIPSEKEEKPQEHVNVGQERPRDHARDGKQPGTSAKAQKRSERTVGEIKTDDSRTKPFSTKEGVKEFVKTIQEESFEKETKDRLKRRRDEIGE